MVINSKIFSDTEAMFALALPYVVNFCAAILIFFIGKWLAKFLIRLIQKGMTRAHVDPTLIGFLGNVMYGLALTVVILAALGQVGIQTTSAAAILGGAALAVGLALKDQLSSFAAGVILIIFRPFRVGDQVEVGGTTGIVQEIKIIHTVMMTFDHQLVIVPNSNITTETITNYSHLPTRRVDLTIGIGYSSDLLLAKETLTRILTEEPLILPDPAPSVVVRDLSDNSVDFAVRGWVNTADWWGVRCALVEKIKLALDEQGIDIPFPQRSVHVEGLERIMEAMNLPNHAAQGSVDQTKPDQQADGLSTQS